MCPLHCSSCFDNYVTSNAGVSSATGHQYLISLLLIRLFFFHLHTYSKHTQHAATVPRCVEDATYCIVQCSARKNKWESDRQVQVISVIVLYLGTYNVSLSLTVVLGLNQLLYTELITRVTQHVGCLSHKTLRWVTKDPFASAAARNKLAYHTVIHMCCSDVIRVMTRC